MAGWQDGGHYTYELRIYSDASYSSVIGSHDQAVVAVRPPIPAHWETR